MFSPNPAKKPLKSCMKKCESGVSMTSHSSSLGYKNTSTACSSSSVATDFSVSSCESSQMDSPLSSSVFSSHSTVSPDYITAYGTITPSMQSSSLGKSLSDLELSKSSHVEVDSDDTFETQFELETEADKEDEAEAQPSTHHDTQYYTKAPKYPYTSYSYEPRVFETLCDEVEQDNRGRTTRRDQKRYSYQQLCQLRQQLELLERARIAGLKGGPLDLHDVREMIDKMRE